MLKEPVLCFSRHLIAEVKVYALIVTEVAVENHDTSSVHAWVTNSAWNKPLIIKKSLEDRSVHTGLPKTGTESYGGINAISFEFIVQ